VIFRHSFSGSFIRSIKVTPRINCCEAIQNRYGLILDNAGVDSEIIAQLQKDIKAALFEVVGAEKVNKKQRYVWFYSNNNINAMHSKFMKVRKAKNVRSYHRKPVA